MLLHHVFVDQAAFFADRLGLECPPESHLLWIVLNSQFIILVVLEHVFVHMVNVIFLIQ